MAVLDGNGPEDWRAAAGDELEAATASYAAEAALAMVDSIAVLSQLRLASASGVCAVWYYKLTYQTPVSNPLGLYRYT